MTGILSRHLMSPCEFTFQMQQSFSAFALQDPQSPPNKSLQRIHHIQSARATTDAQQIVPVYTTKRYAFCKRKTRASLRRR